MVAMSMSEAWLEASVHREAGLAGQLNIETTMMPGFAAMQQAAALGVDAVRLLMVTGARHRRFLTAVRRALPDLDITAGQSAA